MDWFFRSREEIVVSDLFIYPIKSCGPIRVTSAQLDRLGFEHVGLAILVSKKKKSINANLIL
jgi:uncharacterized protein YcbX